jgi:methyl-accepting chemotaxis protein
VKDLNQRTAEAAEATQALMQRVAASVEAQESRMVTLQQSVDRGNGMVERAVRDSGERVARAVEARSLTER